MGNGVVPAAPAAQVEELVGHRGVELGAVVPGQSAACDIYLNDRAYWHNVPAAVWPYKLDGYRVLKKWPSYRERNILARPLTLEEVQHFIDTARRIATILTLTDT